MPSKTHFRFTNNGHPLTCLRLPGWGTGDAIFQGLDAPVNWITIDKWGDPGNTVQDFSTVYQSLPIKTPLIGIGFSMGAYMAVDILRRHPDQVRKLILVSARPGYPEKEIRYQRHRIQKAMPESLLAFYKHLVTKETAQLFRHALTEFSTEWLLKGLDFLSKAQLPEKANEVDYSRFLLIHGKKDTIAPFSEIQKWAQDHQIPLHGIATDGHLPDFKPLASQLLTGYSRSLRP